MKCILSHVWLFSLNTVIFNQICFIIIQRQCDGKKKKKTTKMINKHTFLMKKSNHFPALCWGQHHVLMFAELWSTEKTEHWKLITYPVKISSNIPDLMTERCIISLIDVNWAIFMPLQGRQNGSQGNSEDQNVLFSYLWYSSPAGQTKNLSHGV